jgi:hypothetical protein
VEPDRDTDRLSTWEAGTAKSKPQWRSGAVAQLHRFRGLLLTLSHATFTRRSAHSLFTPLVMRTDRAEVGAGRTIRDRESSPESALSSWDDEPMEPPKASADIPHVVEQIVVDAGTVVPDRESSPESAVSSWNDDSDEPVEAHARTATPLVVVGRTATKRLRRAAKKGYLSVPAVGTATFGRDATSMFDSESSPESAASADEDNWPMAKRLRGSTTKKTVPASLSRGKRRITTQTPTATKRRKTGLATAATVEQLDNDTDDENEPDGDNDDSDSELSSLDDNSEYEAARQPTQRTTWTHTRRPVVGRGHGRSTKRNRLRRQHACKKCYSRYACRTLMLCSY